MILKKNLIIGIILILLSTVPSHALIKNKIELYEVNNLKNYLYASVLYGENKYNLAEKNLNKIIFLKGKHFAYDTKYITSLVINGNLDEAAKLIFDTKDYYSNIFIFEFIKSIYYLKNNNYEKARNQFKNIKSSDPLFIELINSLDFWIRLEKTKNSSENIIKNINSRYSSIKLINQFLSSKYTGNVELYNSFNKQILESENFIRYQIFSAWNLTREKKNRQALDILNSALLKNEKNILLRQSVIDLKQKNKKIIYSFDPKNLSHNLSEIFYLYANLYQQRGDDKFFEILLSISLDFNQNFNSNNLIKFENKLLINNNHKFNYLFLSKLKNLGSEYKWYVDYKLSIQKDNDEIKNLENSIDIDDLFLKNKYFDLANYYRIKKNYKLALDYYKKIEKLDKNLDWVFYYYKGICYERLNQWDESENNLKKSIALSPKEYSVINYLAYSWLERKQNIQQATTMLEEAVKLSNWELGYIIDSLGWAYFLQKDFDKAEELLKIAYEKTPSESEVYDHYGDVLWMQRKFLQARYVWNNALSLDNIDNKRKKRINNKIVNGLNNIDEN